MSDKLLIVGLGETLWDIFPDGPRLGGAPLNFACSCAELGQSHAQVFLASSVGNDELGDRALDLLKQHGVSISHTQTDSHPTGQVLVQLDDAGVASYRFAENSAWDHLSWNSQLENLAADCDAVCFGTLGQRSQQSRDMIHRFVAATSDDSLCILDVNLRAPFFDDDVIRESLVLANVLKLNDDELPLLARLIGATGTQVEMMQQLAVAFQLRCVALTRGSSGAILVCGDTVSDLNGEAVEVADTVGAGDAFTAAMTLGLLTNRTASDVNRHAIAVAAYVCSQSGATMRFPEHLRQDYQSGS